MPDRALEMPSRKEHGEGGERDPMSPTHVNMRKTKRPIVSVDSKTAYLV
jgi:hypothetical protein